MICLSLEGKEFAISKSKNLLYVLAGWEFSCLIMTYYYFNNSKYIYIYIYIYERERNQCMKEKPACVSVVLGQRQKKPPKNRKFIYYIKRKYSYYIKRELFYLKRSYWFCQCETTHYPQNSLVGNSMHQQTQINDQR